MGQEIASQEAATRVLDALRAVDYVGTAGDIILEIEGEFFRVKVTEARIAAIHRFQRRKVDAIKQLEAVLATPPASSHTNREQETTYGDAADESRALDRQDHAGDSGRGLSSC